MRHASPLLLIVLRRICANRSRATGAGEERRERLRYPESLRATLDDRSHIQRDQNGAAYGADASEEGGTANPAQCRLANDGLSTTASALWIRVGSLSKRKTLCLFW